MALKVYLEEDLADEAQRVLEAARDGEVELLAPTLILLEFRHALTRRVRETLAQLGEYDRVLLLSDRQVPLVEARRDRIVSC